MRHLNQPFRPALLAALAVSLFAMLAVPPAGAQGGSPVFKDEAALLETGPLPDMVLGEPDAPVTIVEYASMTCPFCARFHAEVLPSVKEQYIDTGKVRLIYRDFPTQPARLAVAASMLARCVGQERYFAFIDVMFAEQTRWIVEQPVEPLKKLSKQAGLTEEAFDKCLANQELLDGIKWTADRAREEFDVTGTPTLFVNGQKVSGGQALGGELDEIIEHHLGG